MASFRLFGSELVEFQTKDNVILYGLLFRPKRSSACIVHVHGMTSTFTNMNALHLAERARASGISAFLINTRAHDLVSRIKRRKGRKIVSSLGGTSLERFEDCLFDIEGALAALSRMGYKRFILSGHSTGCQKVLYYQYKKKDRRVKGMVFLGAGDDYNLNKKTLGKKFGEKVRMCRRLVRERRGNELNKDMEDFFSAKRFLSVADPKNVEARLFNYDGKLKEFSKITVPVCVLFGSKEEFALKPLKTYFEILKNKNRSRRFTSSIIKGATHTFMNHEDEVADFVLDWVSKVV